MHAVARALRRLTTPWKVKLVFRVWATFAWLLLAVRRHPLPEVVRRLEELRAPRTVVTLSPRVLSRVNARVLRIGPFRPRCLYRALVHYRLLHLQGASPELVIGLPDEATGKDAHAWIEVDGVDVGPRPGRDGHQPLARYPVRSAERPSGSRRDREPA